MNPRPESPPSGLSHDGNHALPHDPIARELFDEIARWPIFDPHSHIDPTGPRPGTSTRSWATTTIPNSPTRRGCPPIGSPPTSTPRAGAQPGRVSRPDRQHGPVLLAAGDRPDLPRLRARPDHARDTSSALYDRADHETDGAAWDREVWDRSQLEAVFLTNDFDDPLEGWDTAEYVPCLRTDDLVLKLHEPATVERLRARTGVDVQDLRDAPRGDRPCCSSGSSSQGARACAISLPPDFAPRPRRPKRAVTPIRRAMHRMDLRPDEHEEVRRVVFWTLAEFCAEFKLPFDLMIGPIRNVYPAGVAGGRDLFDRRVSLHDYRELFNHFAGVTFPVSTLSPDAGAELVAYSWIFPNVVPMGHWWYSNIPAFIAADLRRRLQAVPKVKLVGYYSDAYKLEFVLPKFNMYRRILAEILADESS